MVDASLVDTVLKAGKQQKHRPSSRMAWPVVTAMPLFVRSKLYSSPPMCTRLWAGGVIVIAKPSDAGEIPIEILVASKTITQRLMALAA